MFLISLKENKIINSISNFYKSKYYIILIGFLILLSNIWGIEIPIYYTFVIIGLILPTFICDDLISTIPIWFYAYTSFSKINNNVELGKSLFLNATSKIHFLILIILIVVFYIINIIIKNKQNNKKKSLFFLFSLLFFSLSLMLGGLTTLYYYTNSINELIPKTFFYGLILGASFIIPYTLSILTVNKENINIEYILYLLFIFGFVLTFETINMYRELNFDIVRKLVLENNFKRSLLFTGWANSNNIGAQLALTICAPLFMILYNKNKDHLLVVSNLFLIATIFTQSRGSIIFGLVIFIIAYVIVLKNSTKEIRYKLLIEQLVIILLIAIILLIFKSTLHNLFYSLINSFNKNNINELSSNRLTIYLNGLIDFLKNPVLGNGFYKCTAYISTNIPGSFIPPRYHNSIIQILATSGIIGIIAYSYHRYTTIKYYINHKTTETTFIILTILSILLTSLVDNHLFNIGPTLQYSLLLYFLEILGGKKDDQLRI